MSTIGLVLALGLLAAGLYGRLGGRTWARDTWTRLKLARHDVAHWDRLWQQRQDRSEAVVCLTTIPSRLPRLAPTLKSLLAQDLPVARIRLHLPAVSRREGCGYAVPDWLRALAAVEVVEVDRDWGPATKLIPALEAFAPDQPLIVVDDDMLYPPTLVSGLMGHAKRRPDDAIASSGWVVPLDLTDRPTRWWTHLFRISPAPVLATLVFAPYRVDVVQGYSGYLVRPRFFDLSAVRDYQGAPEAAFFVDDVWFSAHCRAAKWVCPAPRYCMDRWSELTFLKDGSLGRINSGDGSPETRNNTVMIRYFADRWIHHGASAQSSIG